MFGAMTDRNERLFLGGILLLALAIRLLAMLFAPQMPSQSGDEGMYYRLALEVLEKGFLVSDRPPLYPAFIALCLTIFKSPVSVLWIQAIITAFWPLMIWDMGKKLGLKVHMALWAAIAVAVFPPFILYATRAWLSESLFTTLLLLALWGSFASSGFWSGFTWGITSLAKPTSPIMALGYPIAQIAHPRRWLLFLFGLGLIAGSFFIYNSLTGEDRTPYGTHGGRGIVEIIKIENGPCAEGTQLYAGLLKPPEGTDCGDILWRLKRPHTIPVLMLKKAAFLTLPYRGVKLRGLALGPWHTRFLVLLLVVIPDALAFIFGGLYLTFVGIRRREVFPLSWVWLSTLGLALVFHGETRYLLPAMPLFILGAFLLCQEIRRIRPWMLIIWCIFAGLLMFAWVFWCLPFYLCHPLR
ncbi:MAG: hypothetical protein ABIM59_03090 [candidate division WOR-3 bacterium]